MLVYEEFDRVLIGKYEIKGDEGQKVVKNLASNRQINDVRDKDNKLCWFRKNLIVF